MNMRPVIVAIIFLFSLTTFSAEYLPKKWKRVIQPDRTYFTTLSDSEFRSLNPGPAYLAYFMDIWLNRPLKDSDFLSDQPFFATDDDVAFQKRLFTTFKDVRLLGSGVGELIESRNPQAAPLLLSNLTLFKDTQLKADCLNGLAAIGDARIPESSLGDYLTQKESELLVAAANAYATQPYSKASKLLKQLEPLAGMHRVNLIRAAASCDDLGKLEQFQKAMGDNPPSIIAAIPALSKLKPPVSLIETLAKHKDPAVRHQLVVSSINLPRALRESLLKSLSTDPHPSVRAAVASAIGKSKSTANLPQLLKLGDDAFVNVQRETAQSLRQFAIPTAVSKLIDLTGHSKSQLTRDAARESLFSLNGKVDIDGPLGKALSQPNRYIRLNAYRNLTKTLSTTHGPAIADALKKEKHADNISEGIQALVIAVGDKAESQVMRYVNHKSMLVKAAVYDSIGKQKWVKHYSYLKKAASKGTLSESKQAALRAMGLTGNNTFAPEIMWVLMQTSALSEVQSNDRAAACWASARISDISEDIIKRLYKHVMVPLITAPGAPPSFESYSVRTSASFALMTIGQRESGKKKELALRLGKSTVDALSIKEHKSMPCSPQLQYCAYQIKQYIKNEPIDRAPLRPRKFRFTLRKVKQ